MRKTLSLDYPDFDKSAGIELPMHPPRLCEGCGHADAYKAIMEVFLKIGMEDFRVFGDFGCYTLGYEKPHECLHTTTVAMGASVGMTIGAAFAGIEPSVGVIGDLTFFHSGVQSLMSMAISNVNASLIIMDNQTTANDRRTADYLCRRYSKSSRRAWHS